MTSERWHGTAGGYTHHHCRCDECRAAFAAWQRRARLRRSQSIDPDASWHGTPNGYRNHLCRCSRCRAATAAAEREYRARRREAGSPAPQKVGR